MKDTLDNKLEIGGHLHKVHGHPKPLELAPVGKKGKVIRRGALKWDIMETSLEVQYADPLSPPKVRPVPPYVIELVLVLGYPFIDQDYALAHPVGLLGLNTWY